MSKAQGMVLSFHFPPSVLQGLEVRKDCPWGGGAEDRPLGGGHLARFWGGVTGRYPSVPGIRAEAWSGGMGGVLRPQTDPPPRLPAPAGLGLHLCPQLLPLCPGHVLRPPATQGQQEGWKRRAPGQAGLSHPLLCLHLTSHPRPSNLSTASPCPPPSHSQREASCPAPPRAPRRNVFPLSPRGPWGFGELLMSAS